MVFEDFRRAFRDAPSRNYVQALSQTIVATWSSNCLDRLNPMAAATPTPASTTGAAARARERKDRATARKVEWLFKLRRSSEIHHTAHRPPEESVSRQLVDLHAELASLKA